jgi:hypothetical protein
MCWSPVVNRTDREDSNDRNAKSRSTSCDARLVISSGDTRPRNRHSGAAYNSARYAHSVESDSIEPNYRPAGTDDTDNPIVSARAKHLGSASGRRCWRTGSAVQRRKNETEKVLMLRPGSSQPQPVQGRLRASVLRRHQCGAIDILSKLHLQPSNKRQRSLLASRHVWDLTLIQSHCLPKR